MHDNELASRQAALQKALSTALLNHQISELESKVQSIQVSKQQVNSGKKVTAIPGSSPRAQAAQPAQDGSKVKDKYVGLGRIDMIDEDRQDALTHDEDIEPEVMTVEDEDEKWRVVVLDASVLIWALRSVRRLAVKGWELVIPLDAIRTLDLLKKGSSHAAIGARSATRYIEHATRQHKLISSDPSITVQAGTNYKKGIGMRLQRDIETIPLAKLSDLPILIDDIPKWAASVLGCAGWFARINDVEAASDDSGMFGARPTLFVANPPLAVEALQGDDNKDQYTERGEGYLISQEAERFELALEVLRDEEIEDMSFDHASGGSGRRGKGRNGNRGEEGGGRGKGRGGGREGGRAKHERKGSKSKSEEPEREIKILLRRPTPAVDMEDRGDAISLGRGSNGSVLLGGSDIRGSPLAQPPTVATIPPGEAGGPGGSSQQDLAPASRPPERDIPHHYPDLGQGGRGRVRGRGRGRGDGPPSPGRGGFILLKRPDPPARPPPGTDGPPPRPPPPHTTHPPNPRPPPPQSPRLAHTGNGPPPPGPRPPGPPPPGARPPPQHTFRHPPPPEFQPRGIIPRPPPSGPAGHLPPPPGPRGPPLPNGFGIHPRPPRPWPYQPNKGFSEDHSRINGRGQDYMGEPGYGGGAGKKVTLLQRPKG